MDDEDLTPDCGTDHLRPYAAMKSARKRAAFLLWRCRKNGGGVSVHHRHGDLPGAELLAARGHGKLFDISGCCVQVFRLHSAMRVAA